MDFNENQLRVINELDKNIYLTAPAGTGKTMVLSERIKKMLDLGIEGKNILCITFTNKACTELKERVLDRTKGKGKNITVKTFHSFCLSIIKEHTKKKTDIFSDFLVFDKDDCIELVKRISIWKDLNKNVVELNSERLYKCIELIKKIRIEKDFITDDSKNDLKKVIELIKKDINLKRDLEKAIEYRDGYSTEYDQTLRQMILEKGHEIVFMYNNVLINNRALDFNDLLLNAKLLFDNKDIVENYRKKFKYISIDEMQDTGMFEYKIVKKLFYGNNVLLCGDFFQSIYGFRGAKPKEILKDFESFNPIKISFHENYRSTNEINKRSTNFLKNLFNEEYEKTYTEGLKSNSNEEGESLKFIGSRNIEEEAKNIIKRCIEIKNNSRNLRSTCILARTNTYNIRLSEKIKSFNLNLGFEFLLVDEFSFFKRAEIKDIVAFLKVIINENDTVSLERVLKRLNTNISSETLKKVADGRHRKFRVKLNDYLSNYSEFGEYYTLLIEAFDRGEIVVFDVESTGVDVTEDEIIQIAAIRLDRNGREIETFERFIKPSKSVGSSAYIHGFTDEELDMKGEPKEVVFKDFLKFIEGKVVVGHNVNYDISILSSELSRLNMEKILVKGVYDTLEIYRRFHGGLKNHKLEYLSQVFEVKNKPTHDALDDIRATGEILTKEINKRIKGERKEREILIRESFNKFNKMREKLTRIKEKSYELRSYEMIEYLLKEFNFFGSYSLEEKGIKEKNVKKLTEILKITDEKEKGNRDSIIESVSLTSLSNGELEEVMVSRSGVIRIPIITVHQAKGLEYENVLIGGLNEGGFPIKKADYKEEGRIFYVALTRAKKTLTFFYSEFNPWGKREEKSSFLDFL
ncbi:MAG: 3'-5' exonuclease [Clostridium sp.]